MATLVAPAPATAVTVDVVEVHRVCWCSPHLTLCGMYDGTSELVGPDVEETCRPCRRAIFEPCPRCGAD